MASRVHVGELQEALVEARSLHTALRERCAEQERQAERERLAGGAAGSGKDSGAQLEYLKNIVLKLFTMEDGREALLPVIATFLQFSPAEVKRVRLALEAQRLRPADDGWLFGRLGESWLFGSEEEAHRLARPARPQRSAAQASGAAAVNGAADGWPEELERSRQRQQRLRELLFASHEHLSRYQREEAAQQAYALALTTALRDAGIEPPEPPGPEAEDEDEDGDSDDPDSDDGVSEGEADEPGARAAPPEAPAPAPAPAPAQRRAVAARGNKGGGARTSFRDDDLRAAESSLEAELEADEQARTELEVAIRAASAGAGREGVKRLERAVAAMRSRGLDGNNEKRMGDAAALLRRARS